MTDETSHWLPWEALKTSYEHNKKEKPKNFDKLLGAIATQPLLQLLKAAQADLQHLQLPTTGTGLRASLGQQRDAQQRVLWEAAIGLSPVTDRWGVQGLVNIWGASFREGLNLWLDIPNEQPDGVFRGALRRKEALQGVLDALLALPASFQAQLSVGTVVSNRPELKREFPDLYANREKEQNPFKDTPILPANRLLLNRLLELYADKSHKQTLMSVRLWLPSELLKPSLHEVAATVKPMLEALDGLASLWTAVSSSNLLGAGGDVLNFPKDAQQLQSLIRFTRNIILYGPPGTGKTYAVQAFQEQFLQSSTQPNQKTQNLSLLSRWHVLALTLYHAGADEALGVSTMLQEQPLARYEALRGSKTPYASVMTELIERGVDGDNQPVNAKYQRSPAIFLKLPNKTWTLTEQGRQYVEANLLAQVKTDWSAEPGSRLSFVTFHPSFAYEEFVEGLRPETDEEGQLSYRVRDGVFKLICRQAEQELHEAKAADREARPFLLVIDEINRANIAKVFGELMTLIEDDKRVTAQGSGLRVRLPYSGDLFGVPENLYILGTMNTADRSIALLDLALRRRFTFLEVLPDPEVVRRTSGDGGVMDGVDIAGLLEQLNAKLRVMLDRDHQLGHSYLTGIKGGLDELHFRWCRKVIPLLQEYFYNDGKKLQGVLGPAFVKLGDQIGGVGGRLDYDIVEVQGEVFQQALQALLPATTLAVAGPEEPDDE